MAQQRNDELFHPQGIQIHSGKVNFSSIEDQFDANQRSLHLGSTPITKTKFMDSMDGGQFIYQHGHENMGHQNS